MSMIEVTDYVGVLLGDAVRDGWTPSHLRIHPSHWEGLRTGAQTRGLGSFNEDNFTFVAGGWTFTVSVILDERLQIPIVISGDKVLEYESWIHPDKPDPFKMKKEDIQSVKDFLSELEEGEQS